jgi:uncharacterized membrane protein
MKSNINNQRGNILIIFALLLVVLIGFAALAIDVGRWYTVRSELSKSVDAGAIAGQKTFLTTTWVMKECYNSPSKLQEQTSHAVIS